MPTPDSSEETVEIALPPFSGPQLAIRAALEREVLVEGSPRSAKSWGTCFFKCWELALAHPGIQIIYGREQMKSLIALRDIFAKVGRYFPDYLHPTWNPSTESWDFPAPPDSPEPPPGDHFGSRVFLMSFKSSDAAEFHSKYKSRTVAVVVVEEANEIGKRRYTGLKERLSQAVTPWGETYAYPLQIVLVTNCVDEDHWLAKEFPLVGDVCTLPGKTYIRADLYSNAHNLGPTVIAGYEADYPEDHPERRTVIEGRRGLTLLGEPVYKRQFKRGTHIATMWLFDVLTEAHPGFNPYYPLLEGWDFGQEKPAVTWWQYLKHLSAVRLLGAVKGEEVYLETFAPRVLEIRRRLFPHATEVRSHADPTGETGNHGLRKTAVALLHELGVPAATDGQANDLAVRDKAIQTTGGYMLRQAVDGSPAFLIAPFCIELVWQGDTLVEQASDIHVRSFEAGYIWDDKAARSERYPNLRRPKKGTRYDDLQNAGEYIVIGEAIPLAPTVQQLATAAARYQDAPGRQQIQQLIASRQALRKQQRDTHPQDGAAPSRAGIPLPVRRGRRSFY